MSSANTLTGRNGKFVVADTLVARTTEWNITKTLASVTEWGDSDSAGFTNRAAGRKDCTFTTAGKYNTTSEVWDLFQPEDIVVSVLWLDNSSLYWDFPRALCTEFGMILNIDTEEVIGWTANFGSDGVFYYPGESGATPRTLPS